MKFSRVNCSEHELASIEAQWQAQGFRLVQNKRDKELMPYEYYKTSHSGSVNAFVGPVKWELCRREK